MIRSRAIYCAASNIRKSGTGRNKLRDYDRIGVDTHTGLV